VKQNMHENFSHIFCFTWSVRGEYWEYRSVCASVASDKNTNKLQMDRNWTTWKNTTTSKTPTFWAKALRREVLVTSGKKEIDNVKWTRYLMNKILI
jgi:hypothetical protein